MQQTLADVLGKRDIVTDYLVNRPSLEVIRGVKRIKAEIIFQDGTRRFFPCRATSKQNALREVLHFVDCMEKETKGRVAWRFTDENEFYLGSKLPKQQNSFWKKAYEYFFGLDD